MLNGEFLCPRNISLIFQVPNHKLKKRLIDILKDKNVHNYNLSIAIPKSFIELDKTVLTENAINFWENYQKGLFYKISNFLTKDYQYLNSQISRFYIDFTDKSEETMQKKVFLWKKIWENQDLLIIEGESSNLGMNNDLFNNVKSIERIKCPNKNAFDKYDEILSAARKFGENKLLLIALGPTATVLAYDLAKLGFRAIDLGHIDIEYEGILNKVTEKSTIPGKSMTEIENNDDDDNSTNSLEKEIISRIKF